MASSPFAASTSRPGHGLIDISTLPPFSPTIRELSYQYPLKLISPSPVTLPSHDDADLPQSAVTVYTVFLLTYGGGLVAGDSVDLRIALSSSARLVLLTQGSTKIFKTPSGDVVTRQTLTVDLEPGASLCYLPDPAQPFGESSFEQRQIYNVRSTNTNLLACDWVCEGRSARGEKWSFLHYSSRNEIYAKVSSDGREGRKLLLRDNMILSSNLDSCGVSISERMHGMGIFGTLIIGGPVLKGLGEYFLSEFKLLPRLGARQWEQASEAQVSPAESLRASRVSREKEDGILWTASPSRGFFVVKFGARELEGAKRWLREMLKEEASTEKVFGERALLCLR